MVKYNHNNQKMVTKPVKVKRGSIIYEYSNSDKIDELNSIISEELGGSLHKFKGNYVLVIINGVRYLTEYY